MFCSKCGKELCDTDVFCPACGNKQSSNTNEHSKKNIGKILLFIALGFMLISNLATAATLAIEKLSVGILVFNIFSEIFVFVSSIICVVKSKTAKNHNGRVLGIVFTVISSIWMFVLLICMTITGAKLLDYKDDLTSKYDDLRKQPQMTVRVDAIDEDTQKAVDVATESLYYSLDNRNALTVHFAKADVKSGDLEGQYWIYFEYSTDNVSHKVYRVRVFKNEERFAVIDFEHETDMPNTTQNGELYNLNYTTINSAIKDLIALDNE